MAFDAARFEDAVTLYQEMIDQGVESGALHYNLGNALYRTGDIGQAVLAYRRAWFLAPRDPDAQANLRFAMNETTAVITGSNPLIDAIHLVSLPEWWVLATTAWWLLWIALGIAAISSRFRGPLLRLVPILIVVCTIAAFGIFRWSRVVQDREVVVTEPAGVEALYAPLQDAEPHFELPAGSILVVQERAAPWLKVSIDGRDGWILETAVQPVGG